MSRPLPPILISSLHTPPLLTLLQPHWSSCCPSNMWNRLHLGLCPGSPFRLIPLVSSCRLLLITQHSALLSSPRSCLLPPSYLTVLPQLLSLERITLFFLLNTYQYLKFSCFLSCVICLYAYCQLSPSHNKM